MCPRALLEAGQRGAVRMRSGSIAAVIDYTKRAQLEIRQGKRGNLFAAHRCSRISRLTFTRNCRGGPDGETDPPR